MIHKISKTLILLYMFSLMILLLPSNKIVAQQNSEKIFIGEKVVLHSNVLNEDRKLLIRLPENYDKSDQRYPVLYLMDGEFFFQQASSAVQFLSELGYIRNQPIPQMIIVAIVNVDRNRDYTPTYAPKQTGGLEFPTSGKADKFLEHMVSELFPYIESNYRTQPYRILSGWSLGGLLTVYTYLEYPEYFSAFLAISPSLWWDEELYVKKTKSYIERKMISNKKIAVTIGALEAGRGIGHSVRDGFITMMTNEFGKEGRFKYIEIPDEGHYYGPYKALYEGLQLLHSDWQMPGDLLGEGIESIKSFYKKLSEKYGYKINIPESAYSNLANYVYNQVSTEAAVEISKLYVDTYPESSYANFRLGLFNYLMGEFKEAKKYFQEAIELENKTSNPDSERIVTYTINLQKAEKEITDKEHDKK